MPEYLAHQKLAIHNFTAFREVEMEFVAGINVFIGENGTGKTHLMKVLYAFQLAASRDEDIRQILKDLFQVRELESLLRLGGKKKVAQVDGFYGNGTWDFAIHPPDSIAWDLKQLDIPPRPVFVPAIDMMGHTRGFLQAANEVKLDFDLTCTDMVTLLGLEHRNGNRKPVLLQDLSKLLGGTLEYDENINRFYLVTALGRLPMPLVAEGVRKIATLVRLAQNGWLTPGTTLFWDEPEVNLKPVLMDEVVAVLLALTRQGVQVFLATHSYVILKELDLQATSEDHVRFFSLRGRKSGTEVTTAEALTALDPNSILQHYGSLYDRDIRRATVRRPAS